MNLFLARLWNSQNREHQGQISKYLIKSGLNEAKVLSPSNDQLH